MPTFYPANVPLVNYFFYNYTLTNPGPNIPLAGGKVFFFEDEDHTVQAPTYSDVTDPANPVVNENPLVLNDAGAWPLFYTDDRLYYIVITGPDGDLDNPIWTLEHVSFAGAAGQSGANITNYIPNGQFLVHNDIPANPTAIPPVLAGQITQAITPIAYGGWTFERPGDSTAEDFVTFERYDAWSAEPPASPRFAVRVECNVPDSGDAYKDIRVKFPDVNSFSSATQQYTFGFSGKDNNAGDVAVDVYLIKNFGTDGDTETQTLIKTFNLTPTESNFYIAFLFGTNQNKAIGPNNDDYIQLALRLRTDESIDVLFTDILLEQGDVVSPAYPPSTQRRDIAAALGGAFPIPDPLGMDLYLTPRLTVTGWVYDTSEIGDIIAESQLSVYVNSLHPDFPRMLGDGNQYPYDGYSPLGVPWKRLGDKYWNSTANIYQYGTGKSYMSAWYSGSGNELVVTNNSTGAVTDAAVNTSGFTVANIAKGSDYHTKAYKFNSNTFALENLELGAVPASTAETSGFTITVEQDATTTPSLPQITGVLVTAATSLAGKYFNFDSYHTTAVAYYVWFKVDGVGIDPAPAARTGILISLNGTDTDIIVAEKIREALNGWQVTSVKTTAASAITGGTYWTINSSGTSPLAIYVWYKKDGVGTDPALGGKIGIEVDIIGTDTNAQVAIKTQIALNKKYFAARDLRGAFLRGWDNGAGNDPEAATRWSLVPGIIGDVLGTSQEDANQQHIHELPMTPQPMTPGGQGCYNDIHDGIATPPSGGYESRPTNTNVNYVIKY